MQFLQKNAQCIMQFCIFADGYVVKDDIEYPYLRTLPLWTFGFLYSPFCAIITCNALISDISAEESLEIVIDKHLPKVKYQIIYHDWNKPI